MGQQELISCLRNTNTIKPHKNMFTFIDIIGKGSYSKVWKVKYSNFNKPLALKAMNKHLITSKRMQNNIITEKKILSTLYNPFIANMYCTFQDTNYLYMVMDYAQHGDLRYQMSFIRNYTEDQLRFIAGCIVLSLECVHSKGIIHRDIKPENIICDDKGYMKLCDFGIAVKLKNEHKGDYLDMSGTPGYIPPEVVYKKRVSYESDYFALGILMYELIMDDLPFKATTPQQMKDEYDNVVNGNEYLTTSNCGYSQELCEFVNGLLEKDNTKRLGRFGSDEVKAHKFFGKKFNWKYLELRQMKCPFTVKEFNYDNMNDDNVLNNSSNHNSKGSCCCSSEGSATTNDNSPKGKCDNNNNNNDNCYRKYTFIRKVVKKGFKNVIMSYRTKRHESIDASYHIKCINNSNSNSNINNESNVNMKLYKSTMCSPVKSSVNHNMLTKLSGKHNHHVKMILQKTNGTSSVPKLPVINKTRSNSKSNIKNDIMDYLRCSLKGKVMNKQPIDFSSQICKYKLITQKTKKKSCVDNLNTKSLSGVLC